MRNYEAQALVQASPHMVWVALRPDLQPSFDRFARGLKQRVEAG